MAPGPLPIVGHAIAAARNPRAFFANAVAQCGPSFTINFFGSKMVVLGDTDAYRDYFKAKEGDLSFHENLNDMEVYRALFGRPTSMYSLIAGRATMKMLAEKYEDVIVQQVTNSVAELPEEGIVDLMAFSKKLISHIVCVVLLNKVLDESICEDVLAFEQEISKAIATGQVFGMWWVKYVQMRKIDAMRERILVRILPHVQEARNNRTTLFEKFIFDTKTDDGELLTDYEISMLVLSISFGALSNTVRSVANCLLLVAHNPEKAEDLKQQIKGRPVLEVPILDGWVMEMARQCNGHLGSGRRVDNVSGLEVGGYQLKQGVRLMVNKVSPFLTEDYDEFKPERFLESGSLNQYAVLNWGAGVHVCPGKRFAINETKHSIAYILNHLKMTPRDLAKGPLRPALTIADSMGIYDRDYSVRFVKC